MSFLMAFLGVIGDVIAKILPGLMEQWRKPQEVKYAGDPKEIQDDINTSIDAQLDTPPATNSTGNVNGVRGTSKGEDSKK